MCCMKACAYYECIFMVLFFLGKNTWRLALFLFFFESHTKEVTKHVSIVAVGDSLQRGFVSNSSTAPPWRVSGSKWEIDLDSEALWT